MQDCSEALVLTMIIDIWMLSENVQKLGITERFLIYIAIYVYIFYLSNLLIFLLNKVHYTIVLIVKILLYSLCLIVCNVSGSVANATRNHSTNGAYTRSGHIKTEDRTRNRSTNSTSTDFGKSSLYILRGIYIGIAYR